MVAEVDIANRALNAMGTRSQVTSLSEISNEAINANLLFANTRDELLRLAPWNCATTFVTLTLICAAPGTPENPTAGSATWQKGTPPPPWAYEYAYPSDCIRFLYIIPQFATGFSGGTPITTALTGGPPNFWNGPPVRFKIALDQIGPGGLPIVGGDDTKVILTNQQQAISVYVKRVTNPDVWDAQFQEALAKALAFKLAIPLSGDKALARHLMEEANNAITLARQGDGNEGLTINDVTPDWIRVRGIYYPTEGFTPNAQFDWGPMLTMF